MDKIEYLEARQEWKDNYAVLSQRIRDLRAERKQAQVEFSKLTYVEHNGDPQARATWWAAYKTELEARRAWVSAKAEARRMIEKLEALKEIARAAYKLRETA